jgi:uncharacterized membrane protein YcaP (DUF421 family)
MFDIIFRTSVVYVAILIGLRVAGKRQLGQLAIHDFVLILLISNAVQNAMVGDNNTLVGGLCAAGVLIILNVILSFAIFRNRTAKKILEGSPTLLAYDGHYILDHLHKVEITEDELLGVIREHGLHSIDAVRMAVLELDGTISIVPEDQAPGSLKTNIHKWRQRKRHEHN